MTRKIRRHEDMANFLGQLYNRDVDRGGTWITVIRFSAIKTNNNNHL